MKVNVGPADKIFRIILGIGLFSLFFFLEGNLRYIAVLGFIPLFVAFTKSCSLYSLLGVNTCGTKSTKES